MNVLRILVFVCLASFATEQYAAAYTDPGSGVLLWQMLLAALAGAAFYFRRFTSWFRSRRGPRN
jgi:hypothetical protein